MHVTKGIEWIITCTTNFDETVAFFCNVMGLTVTEEGVPVTDTQFTRYAQITMPNGVMLEIVEPGETGWQRGSNPRPLPGGSSVINPFAASALVHRDALARRRGIVKQMLHSAGRDGLFGGRGSLSPTGRGLAFRLE